MPRSSFRSQEMEAETLCTKKVTNNAKKTHRVAGVRTMAAIPFGAILQLTGRYWGYVNQTRSYCVLVPVTKDITQKACLFAAFLSLFVVTLECFNKGLPRGGSYLGSRAVGVAGYRVQFHSPPNGTLFLSYWHQRRASAISPVSAHCAYSLFIIVVSVPLKKFVFGQSFPPPVQIDVILFVSP